MTRYPRFLVALAASALFALRLDAQISIIGDLSQDREAHPGESYNGSIIVRNDGASPEQAKLYQTDYLFFANGTNNYGEPGTMPRSNARWVSFSPSYVTVPPLGTVAVNYTVAVPESLGPGVRPSGSYWSMLMVEGLPNDATGPVLSPGKDRQEMGLRQTLRYGIQIATHIAGTGTKSVKFVQARLVRPDSRSTFLQVDIENNGTLWFRPDVYVELFDAGGVSKGKFPGQKFRMYPGTSVRQMIDLSTIPAGRYKALVVLDAGGEDVYGAQYTLDF